MNASKTNPRLSGSRWTVAEAKSLLPAAWDFLKEACSHTESRTAHMSLVEQPSEELIHFTAAGTGSEVYKVIGRQFKERVALRAVSSKKAVNLGDVHQEEEWKQAWTEAKALGNDDYVKHLESYGSELAVPLLDSQDSVVGCINVHHRERYHYKKEHEEQLKGLASAVSLAVENAMRYVSARHDPSWGDDLVLQAHREISTIRVRMDAGEPLCNAAVRTAMALCHAECAALWLLHPPTPLPREWHLASLATAAPVLPGDVLQYRTGEEMGIRGHVRRTEQPYYCPDTTTDPHWFPCVLGIRSCYTAPLFYNDKLFAVLCVDSYRLDAFDQKLRKALELFTRLLGAHLGAAFRQSRERVENTYGPELIRAVTRDELCRRTVVSARSLVDAESASLFLITDGGGESLLDLAATTGLAPDYNKDTTYRLGEGITGWVAARRVPLRLRNCADEAELKHWEDKEELRWKGKTREIASRKGFERPLLAVPVLDAGGVCLGVIRASGKRDGTEFREEDCVALEQCAGVLARELGEIHGLPLWSQVLDDPKGYFRELLKQCRAKCEATASTIDLVAEGCLINVDYIGPLIVPEKQLTRALTQNSVAVLCANSGLVQSVPDVSDVDWKNIYQECFEGTKSELAVPVLEGGKVVAVVNLESTEIGHFTPERQARAEKYANLVTPFLGSQHVSPSPLELTLAACRSLQPANSPLETPNLEGPRTGLRWYAGQYVALSLDGSTVVASAPDLAALDKALVETGEDPSTIIVEFIPDEDTHLGGAQLL